MVYASEERENIHLQKYSPSKTFILKPSAVYIHLVNSSKQSITIGED